MKRRTTAIVTGLAAYVMVSAAQADVFLAGLAGYEFGIGKTGGASERALYRADHAVPGRR